MKLKRIITAAMLMCLLAVSGRTVRAEEGDRVLVIDLTKGYYVCSNIDANADYSWPMEEYQREVFYSLDHAVNGDTGAGVDLTYEADVDKDGTIDIVVNAYDWPDSEGMPGRVFIIPTAGGSIRGTYSLKVPQSTDAYYGNKFDTIQFIFPDEPIQKEYKISAESGKVTDQNGREITTAAPGSWIRVNAVPTEGKYVAFWKSDLIGEFSTFDRDYSYWSTCVAICMPAADVSLSALLLEQKPLTFDLTEGFCRIDEGYNDAGLYDLWIGGRLGVIESGTKLDIDGDGTEDVICYVIHGGEIYGACVDEDLPARTFFIPLPTASIHGTYTTKGTSTSAFWPYTFTFPAGTVKNSYKITVEGGHAENEAGRTITEAAPGEKIRIVCDKKTGSSTFPDFKASPAYEDLEPAYRGTERCAREEVMMPACDITYTEVGIPEEGGTYVMQFEMIQGGRYEHKISEEERAIWSDEYPIRIMPFYKEYELYDIVVESDRVLLESFSEVRYEGPKPAQLYFLEPVVIGNKTYDAFEVQFGTPVVFYPINSDVCNVYTSFGCEPLKGAYEGQELLVFPKDDSFKLYAPDVHMDEFWGTSGLYYHFLMPAHEVTIQSVSDKYRITVVNGEAGYQFYEPIVAAYPGEWIIVYPPYTPREDGYYYTGMWESDDVRVDDYKEGAASFIMPDHDVTVTAEIKKQEPVTVDLRTGSAQVDWEVCSCLLEASGDQRNGVFIDLNGDRTDDIIIDWNTCTIKTLEAYSCGEKLELTGRTMGMYYPVTVLYDPETANKAAEITPDEKQASDPDEDSEKDKDKASDSANDTEKADSKKNKEKDSDGFNLLYVIIPAAVLLCGGIVTWVVLKKKKAK